MSVGIFRTRQRDNKRAREQYLRVTRDSNRALGEAKGKQEVIVHAKVQSISEYASVFV